MRQVMRVPMMLKMLRSEENRKKVLEYWFQIPGGEQTEIGHPYYEIESILDNWEKKLANFEELWRNNTDLRLPQVLINSGIMSNFTGFYYYIEDEETFIEAGIFEPRDILFWGQNYNEKMEKLPETKWILVKNMDTAHIQAILNDYNKGMAVSPVYIKAFNDELELRQEGDIIVCEECGCEEVQSKQWVECNTGNLYDLADSQGEQEQDNWCPDCDAHCSITSKKVFNNRNNEEE